MIINTIVMIKGNLIATSGWDGKVMLWSSKTNQLEQEIQLDHYVNHMNYHNESLYVGGKDGSLTKINIT